MNTPMLDKAKTEELTSSEIVEALRELGRLERDCRAPNLICDMGSTRRRWSVEFETARRRVRYSAECAEDALIKAHEATLKLIAEERAADAEFIAAPPRTNPMALHRALVAGDVEAASSIIFGGRSR